MKLPVCRPKNNLATFDQFFNLDHPFIGLSLFPELTQWNEVDRSWIPPIDVEEGKDQLSIKVDLPGLQKQDIEVSAEGSVLTIKGQRKSGKSEKDRNFRRVERSFGQFVRKLDVGAPIDAEKVKAAYQDGVLEVLVKTTDVSKQKKIEVT